MKGKKHLQALSFLCVLFITSGFASYSQSPVTIENISVQSGVLHTRVILEPPIAAPITHAYYLEGSSPTLALELGEAKLVTMPKFSFSEASLVQNIRTDKNKDNTSRLLIDLKAKVPYRIYPEKEGTAIELKSFQNSQESYVLSPDIKQEVEKFKGSSYLKDIHISESSEKIDITAKLTDRAVPNVFVLNNPLRLVVDLHNTMYAKQASSHLVQKLGVKKIRTAQFQVANPYTITRMVFDLESPSLYSLISQNNEVTISFYKNIPVMNSTALAPKIGSETPEVDPPQDQVQPEQKSEPTPDTEKSTPVVKQEPKKILDPPTMKTEEEIAEKNIEASEKSAGHKNGPSPSLPQELQFQSRTLADAEEGYSGELITLKFKDADLQAVVFYLAEFAGLNVTFDPGVTGIVSVNLVDVPWDQALDLILKQNKMGKIIEGNVLRVAPIGVLMQEQEQQRRLKESKEMAGPLLVKTFTLSYSKAADVQGLLSARISNRGKIIVDSRTNTMIIEEVSDKMDILERLIDVFDTPTPQVSIEARIVEATSTFIRNLGIQWGFRGISDPFYGNQTSLKFPNSALIDGAMIPQGIVTRGIGGPLGGYAINLPSPAFTSVLGFSFANVLDTFRLDVALSALETSGSGRIISAPKVTTQNNQQAEIIQGRQIPVQTVANFTVSTRYVNAALELRATPQITAEGTVIMQIEIQNNAADFANLVNGIPPIIRQSAQTTVMVPDGGTTVIGGIYRTEDSITREKVPFLHKIPILGGLFKNFARTKQNRELLIFITPRIIK